MMPTTLLSVFCQPHRQCVTTPTPASRALKPNNIILKNSHPISSTYHSISSSTRRGPLPLCTTLAEAPSAAIDAKIDAATIEKEYFPFNDFKVGKVEGQKLVHGVTMPLVLQPAKEAKDIKSLLLALEKNKEWLKETIAENGAVLVRGFDVENAEDFSDVVESLEWDPIPYIGPSPRTNVYKHAWTANEGPLSQTIPFHHEMALMKPFPQDVIFFCEVPPPEGGETPIVPSYRVAERVEEEFPEVVKEIEEKGLKYTFLTPPQPQHSESYSGRSWQEFFGSPDREDAARKAKANADVDVEWQPDGGANLVLVPRPLTRVFEGRKGRKVWFNIVHIMSRKEIATVTMMDGTPIPENFARRVEEIIEEESIQFRWEKGDVMFVDNLTVKHGRRPSLPPRKVLVAICNAASYVQ